MSVNIENVVTVQLLEGAQLALADNPNVCLIMTSQQDGPINSANRYQVYSDPGSVSADFGTSSAAASFANAFFATSPNPIAAGGRLVMGYWRGESEAVAATAATLTGGQLQEVTIVDQMQQISDGSMTITVDAAAAAQVLSALDFQAVTSLADIAGVIDTALTGATATESNGSILITSPTTGALSTLTYATAHTAGTFIGDILNLTDGSGAVLVQGAAAATLAVETMLEAITELASLVKFRGAMFISKPLDTARIDLAEWAQANNVLMYDVFDDPTNLALSVTNPVWGIKLAGRTNYRMLYSKAGSRKLAATYMARVHTVNFAAENTALTMQLKELAVSAESYTQTEVDAASRVGLDIYTTIKQTATVLTSGANNFVDERYNLIAYVDFLQVDMYNLLRQTATKIPQTRRGISQLVDQAEKTTRQFVRAGVIAPGTWTSPDFFGNYDTFLDNVLTNGYYFLAGALADQSQAAREARKSPVIQGAIKLAGAVHSVDLVIFVNR
ncbi:MAG: DUF3383 family protein [Desulfobacterales bacterium]|nr:DUF3383 family protein [Desulfobacterales bacterium]